MVVAKFLGRDCELSTTGVDAKRRSITPWEVTQRVLEHIDAAFAPTGHRCWSATSGHGFGASAYSSDCLRRWAPNGQCYYADMAHVEVCTAEALAPHEFAAQCWSTLRVAEAARKAAQAAAASGVRYLLTAANVDASDPGVSWGTHLNVSVSKPLFDDLLVDPRRPPVLGFVASALAAAIPFFGSGYVLPLRDGSAHFSLSARAHHITRVWCDATTVAFGRGLLNTRREAHARDVERLHLIGFDFALVSAALLGAFVQAALAAAEAGFGELELAAPLDALHAWTLGIDAQTGALTGMAELRDGRTLGLAAYMAELAKALACAIATPGVAAAVGAGTADLLARIVTLAERLAVGDLDTAAAHLDWAAKLRLLQARGAALADPATRLFDHDFASTDPARSPLLRLWERGLVDPLITTAQVDACVRDGPAAARGWVRGRLVQRLHAAIADVGWDQVDLALTSTRLGRRVRIDLGDVGKGKTVFAPLLEDADDAATLASLAAAGAAPFSTFQPLQDLRREIWSPRAGHHHHHDQ